MTSMPQSGISATPCKGLTNNHSEYPGGKTVPGILNTLDNVEGLVHNNNNQNHHKSQVMIHVLV